MKKFIKGLVGITVALGLFVGTANVTEARDYDHFDEPPFEAYKVYQGDSFFYIGERYGVDYRELMRINPNVDPHNMRIGSTIKLVDNSNNNNSENQFNSSANATELAVFELVNQERAKHGLSALKIDDEVGKVARAKSQDMSDNNYFSHTSPTYGSPFDMLKHYGVSYRSAGENIAAGQRSAENVMDSWMNSPGHRQNILSDSFTHIGIGYVEGGSRYGNYWTQMFISK
ncbi:CAP domain-containing protein [Salipaludibacillus sp. HK11]|uniref:CAP domain-containing protein n=1 Tax=Salipaludibacillus sp. HK11 TaxID=3394320 RepID=UPI0039FD101A